jgi:hypothetical protein
LTASLITALAVGFLFAGGAAILGDATGFELDESHLADGADALLSGLRLCIIEFGQQKIVLGIPLVCQEHTELLQFGKGQVQGNHGAGLCYDWLVTFSKGGKIACWAMLKNVTSIS